MTTTEIAIIGAGVRGTAALGRLAARLRAEVASGHWDADARVTVHVVDEFAPGSGRIWRADQPRSLVMNTVPAQSTVFGDATLGFAHDSPGPSFAEWCQLVDSGDIPAADVAPDDTAGDTSADTAWVRETARSMQPWSYPSRALYGSYLRWAYAEFARSLPPGVHLIEHRATATAVRRRGHGGFEVELAPVVSGRGITATDLVDDPDPDPSRATADAAAHLTFRADAVLLALGWLPRHPGDSFDVPPESPIDQRLERLLPGETVAVRGVGMGFTDLLGLVTEERGGRFTPRPEAGRASALSYEPSGQEPVLIAGSRSALPFLAKPDFGAVPPAAALTSLNAAMPRLLASRPLDFSRDVLPLIEADAAAEYHRVFAELHPLDPSAAPPFNPWSVAAPYVGTTAESIDAEIAARLEADAGEAALGMRSAVKRGLHVFQAARAAIIPLTDFSGITHESAPSLDRFLMVAGLIGSGPPLFRVEQLLAAHRAGIVRFAGPGMSIESRDGHRELVTPRGLRIPVDRVVDARLDLPDPTRHASPLLESLLATGLARLWQGGHTGAPPTLEITADSSALVAADGSPTAGLHSVGPLHEELRRFTIIAPIPGVGSTVLREIDAAIAAMLDVAGHPANRTERAAFAPPSSPDVPEVPEVPDRAGSAASASPSSASQNRVSS